MDNNINDKLVEEKKTKQKRQKEPKKSSLFECLCPCLVSKEAHNTVTTDEESSQNQISFQNITNMNNNTTEPLDTNQELNQNQRNSIVQIQSTNDHNMSQASKNNKSTQRECLSTTKKQRNMDSPIDEYDEKSSSKHHSDTGKRSGILNQNLTKREQKAAQRLLLRWQASDMPKNEIFVLYDQNNQDFVMAKFGEKKIRSQKSIDYTNNNTHKQDASLGLNTTLLTDFDGQTAIVPQKIAQHIAKRCKDFSFVLDACCGVGGVTLQLAKSCDFCISCDINSQRMNFAKENCKKYGVSHKVEFVASNLFDINCNQKFDLVFIHPSFDKDNYDLFTNTSPNLPKALSHCAKMSKNIVLLLPADVDIKQLPTLFYQFYKSQVVEDLNNYTIEIEQITYNKKQTYYIVYYGQCSNVEDNEEIMFLQKRLGENNGANFFDDRIQNFLNYLTPKIGIRGIVKFLNKADKLKASKPNQTILQLFLDLLVEKKVLNRNDIQQHMATSASKQPVVGSFDMNNQQLSFSFNSKLFQNSHDSNDFQMALSPNQKKKSIEDKTEMKNTTMYRKSTFEQKNSYSDEDIIQGSKYSDLRASDSEYDNDEDYQASYYRQTTQRSQNKSRIQKAHSQDFVLQFRGRHFSEQSM